MQNEMIKRNETWSDFLTDTTPNVNSTERVVSALAGGALLLYGVRRGGPLGAAMSALGGTFAYRGLTGHCHAYDALGIDTAHTEGRSLAERSPFTRSWLSGKVHVRESVTIRKSPEELYAFWRNFENLPQFMQHLESVTTRGETWSHWKAKAPLGTTVEWDAELTSDVLNEKIGWKSVEGSQIPNSGTVEFLPAPDGGTEVRVNMIYEAPGGKLGSIVAKIFGEEPGLQVADDLKRLKHLLETGSVTGISAKPTGTKETGRKTAGA